MPSKLIFEPDSTKELLRGWLLHSHKARDRHDTASRQYNRYHHVVGVPMVILSTLVGNSVFASLQENNNPLRIITAILSIVAAFLAAIQTFYNYSARAEKHRNAGSKYKEVIRQLEQLLTQSSTLLNQPVDEKNSPWLNEIRKRLDSLEEESPVVPLGIYNRVEKNYQKVEFKDQAEQLYSNSIS
ncbi:MAG TPA: DUF4231 domain-containing protein [Chitinophagales bacterium]|nr:DUF4231 domain-containing protein [Chitinophagales bacterium]